jgi:hypothetical protein
MLRMCKDLLYSLTWLYSKVIRYRKKKPQLHVHMVTPEHGLLWLQTFYIALWTEIQSWHCKSYNKKTRTLVELKRTKHPSNMQCSFPFWWNSLLSSTCGLHQCSIFCSQDWDHNKESLMDQYMLRWQPCLSHYGHKITQIHQSEYDQRIGLQLLIHICKKKEDILTACIQTVRPGREHGLH